MPLLLARHRDREDIDDPGVIKRLAGAAGLDGDRFGADLADRRTLEALARDHSEARAKRGVFGTPTFVFPNGAAAYVRLAGVPSKEDALRIFDRLVDIARGEESILEIKRPVAPV